METSRPYRIQSNRLISLVDPAEMPDGGKIEGGAFTVTGTILTVDLGREGQQKLWEPYAGKEATGERVRMTVRLREPGEWQVRGILSQGESVVRAWLALLGWSTEAQAYWTDYETAFMRAFRLESAQCRGGYPCTIRFPYDPYRFALQVPLEAPGRSLRERPTTFCNDYERPGTCAEHGIHEFEPWERGLEPPPPGFCEEGMNRLSAICEEWLRERPEERAPTPSPDARALPPLLARPTRPLPTRPIPRPTPTPGTPIPPGPRAFRFSELSRTGSTGSVMGV